MQPARTRPQHAAPDAPDQEPEEEPLPSFSEQMAQQLGGVRGLIESSVPVLLFVIVNFLGSHFKWWSLRASLIVAVGWAPALAAYRLARKETPRHALYGVFGGLVGGLLA